MQKKQNRPGFDRKMTRDEINALAIRKYEGPVQIINSREELEKAANELGNEKVLGFDTETRPTRTKGQYFPPSLIQLAGSRNVYLFQLKSLKVPGPLREILATSGIIKAGVAVDHDISELQKLSPFEPSAFVDLGKIARQAGLKNHGLRGLAAAILGFRISKSAQQSNWAQDDLTTTQIRYAATDAWTGRELFLAMKKENLLSYAPLSYGKQFPDAVPSCV